MDEGLLPAWDQVHLHELRNRAFGLYGAYHQISQAEAETLIDVYHTPQAAAAALSHIPIELLTRAMADARWINEYQA